MNGECHVASLCTGSLRLVGHVALSDGGNKKYIYVFAGGNVFENCRWICVRCFLCPVTANCMQWAHPPSMEPYSLS